MSRHMGSWMLVESGVVSKVWLCWRGCPPPPKRLTALPSTHPTWWVSNRAAPFTEWAVYSHALLQRHARLASHQKSVTTHMNRSGHQAPDLRLLLRSSPLWDACRRLPGGHLELEEALSLFITRIGS